MAESDLFRVYLDPKEIGNDGYPWAWRGRRQDDHDPGVWLSTPGVAIKDLVREQAGHRCVRCQHPFVVGETPGEWSPCDEYCYHSSPVRVMTDQGWQSFVPTNTTPVHHVVSFGPVEAQWRILTVHHLNGIKHDCRWWNLAALCQRCHLTIQAKVYMERPWTREHSEWFRPYVAGFYAWRYLELELDREETMARLDELLALEDRQLSIEEA